MCVLARQSELGGSAALAGGADLLQSGSDEMLPAKLKRRKELSSAELWASRPVSPRSRAFSAHVA